MKVKLKETIDILKHLVGFKTVSGTSTKEINKFIIEYLEKHDVEAILSYDEDRKRANIFATIGPEIDGGVLFNGHTDVVETGKNWTFNPFEGQLVNGLIYGRGACDMKGGIASSIIAVES